METQLPGDRIRQLRKKTGLTVRELAVECNPPMDFSTVARIENNHGYTSCSMMRMAEVIGCETYDFFLPDGLAGYTHLTQSQKEQVHSLITELSSLNDKDTQS